MGCPFRLWSSYEYALKQGRPYFVRASAMANKAALTLCGLLQWQTRPPLLRAGFCNGSECALEQGRPYSVRASAMATDAP